jgi:hypothetical protein
MDMHMDPVTPGGVPIDGSGQAAQEQQAEQQDQEQSEQQQTHQQQTELTETIRTGLEAMSGRRQEIHAKVCMHGMVECLASAACHVVEVGLLCTVSMAQRPCCSNESLVLIQWLTSKQTWGMYPHAAHALRTSVLCKAGTFVGLLALVHATAPAAAGAYAHICVTCAAFCCTAAKIDDLSTVVLQFLEAAKQNFMQLIDR